MRDDPTHEQRRLAALGRYDVLDSPREAAFDEIAALAAAICRTPIAVVNFVGDGRQFFKAEVGLGVRETPLETSFCAHALLEEDLLVVPDAAGDPRFACNPLVTAEGGLRFYAGALLKTGEGHAIGTLCVLDYEPRTLDATQLQALQVLSRQVMAQLDLRVSLDRSRAAAAQLRWAQRAGGIGVFIVGRDNIIHPTPELCRMFGVEVQESLSASRFEELIVAEDRALVSSATSRAAGTQLLEAEYRIRRADTGAVRWIARRGEIERDGNGRPLHFAGVARDITDQVAAREALAAERELLAQMFEQAPTFMALLSGPAHRIERVNPGFVRLIGGRAVVGRGLAEALPDAAAQGFVALLDQVYRTGEPHIARGQLYAVQTGPGEPIDERYVDYVYQPIRDASGAVTGIFIEGADVTERAAAASALRAAETRYQMLMRSIDVGFCVIEMLFDADGKPRDYRFVETNEAFESQSGLTDVVGRTMRELHPGYEQYRLDIYGAVATTRQATRFENGSAPVGRWWDVHALPIGEPHEQRVAVLFSDITPRRQIEEQLRQLNATLESQVEARTRELLAAEEALRQAQKMEAVGQLTGGIAHDFNNMLTGVIGSIDLIQRNIAQGKMDKVARYLDAASSSAQRAAALTARLLAFGRRQSLDLRAIDVNQLVGGMGALLHTTLGEHIAIETHLAEDVWAARSDPNQLESALLNLCINARDAMPAGGKLTVETANARLDARYVRDNPDVEAGDYVALAVSDTGQGMTKETIARAFEPFFTTKPVGEGTGLGLSMIYGFARQSGGHVRIYSEPGRGTTVKLYIPRFRGEAEADVAGTGTAPPGAGETVMVVEDDAAVRLIVLDVLEELGYAAIEAVDAASALPILRSGRRIDLLVSDVGLPGINGRQLAEMARQMRPDLRILFITGYAQNAAVRSGFLGQGMEMMTKPFAVDALATRLRAMLES